MSYESNTPSVNHRGPKMISLTRIGIAIFTLSVVLGPLYTVPDYSVVSNLISELGDQHTQNNFIMIIGFIALGG